MNDDTKDLTKENRKTKIINILLTILEVAVILAVAIEAGYIIVSFFLGQ